VFLPAPVSALEEYGGPSSFAEKLVTVLNRRGDLDEGLERLTALNVGPLPISEFERSQVADAQDGLG